ncbi:hypothetical protein TNCV_202651 [Trichonephila clavipes]|nr:hypothetical protein TNCV_202651 [Trichonephila clavipes]
MWPQYPSAHGHELVAGVDESCVRVLMGLNWPVVKVSDHGIHVMSSSPAPLKTRRVGQRYTLNLSRAETSSRGVVW